MVRYDADCVMKNRNRFKYGHIIANSQIVRLSFQTHFRTLPEIPGLALPKNPLPKNPGFWVLGFWVFPTWVFGFLGFSWVFA